LAGREKRAAPYRAYIPDNFREQQATFFEHKAVLIQKNIYLTIKFPVAAPFSGITG